MQAGTPTDNCGDSCPWRTTVKLDGLISRAAFRKDVQTVLNDTACPLHIAAEIEQIIDLAPTVDAVPVIHGRWSEKRWMTDDDWGVINHRTIVCSACKREIADGKQTRYCPNCGAKMDGKDSE